MARANAEGRDTESSSRESVTTLVDPVVGAIPDPLSLKFVLVGVLLIIGGFVLQEGVIPGFMVIWGTALTLVGSVAYLVLWYTRPE